MIPIFVPKSTPISRLSALTKLIYIAGVVLVVLAITDPLASLILLAATIPAVAFARIWKEWGWFMRIGLIFTSILVFFNALVLRPPDLFGIFSTSGIVSGSVMAIRFLTVTSAFSILAYGTNPDEVLRLLSRRAYKSGIAASIAFRLVPTLLEDMKRSGDAARSRGFELDSGPFVNRMRMRSAAFMPVVAGSLERGLSLAESLESRGFGANIKRTNTRKLSLPRSEVIASLIVICTAFIALVLTPLGLIPPYSFGNDYEFQFNLQLISLASLIAICLNAPVMAALYAWKRGSSTRWTAVEEREASA